MEIQLNFTDPFLVSQEGFDKIKVEIINSVLLRS